VSVAGEAGLEGLFDDQAGWQRLGRERWTVRSVRLTIVGSTIPCEEVVGEERGGILGATVTRRIWYAGSGILCAGRRELDRWNQ
jgi:hypothetical protein